MSQIKTSSWLLLFLLTFWGQDSLATFWQGRTELEKQLFQEGKILVSVTSSSRSHLKGGGVVMAPGKVVAEVATNPEKLKANIPEIRELDWSPQTGPFKVKIKFLWLEREIEGSAKFREETKSALRGIDFLVEKGLWFTMKGALEIRELEPHKSLVVIHAETEEGQTFSWPVRVGLEATLQRMAGSLRNKVESEVAK